MNYQSTRNAALTASSAEAILNGLAPDGGLYAMPALSGLDFDWQRCLTLSTQGMATEILCALLPDFTRRWSSLSMPPTPANSRPRT